MKQMKQMIKSTFQSNTRGRFLTLPPDRSADFPVRSNVERQKGFRRLLEPWEGRGLLRTGKSALRWRCQDARDQLPCRTRFSESLREGTQSRVVPQAPDAQQFAAAGS